MTAQELFDYATAFRKRTTRFPKFKQCARHFRVRLDDIEEAVSCADDLPMEAVVGWSTAQGIAEIKHQGDYEVETWNDK